MQLRSRRGRLGIKYSACLGLPILWSPKPAIILSLAGICDAQFFGLSEGSICLRIAT